MVVDATFEQVQLFFQNLDPTVALTYFDKLQTGTLSLADAFKKLNDSNNGATKAVQDHTDKLGQLSKVIEGAKGAIKDLAAQYGFAGEKLDEMLGTVSEFAFVLGSGLKADGLLQLSNYARDASDNLGSVNEKIKGVQQLVAKFPAIGEPISKVVSMAMPFKMLADDGKKAEAGMIGLAAASGELGDLLEKVGDDFSGLDDHLKNYNNLLVETAMSTGNTVSQVGKYAAMLGRIPGALEQTVDITKDGQEQMKMLDLTMKLAAGTGQSFEQVFEDLNHVYREFGTTGDKAAQYIARLSAASQGLKMPLDIVKTYVRSAADSFKFLGDNSQGAINVLGKIGPALKDSGLGPQAIADLTKNVVGNLAQMSIAQNAFLSKTAGGIGGLQGAFQIDLLKKQGKLDEVEKMAEESLKKQFGGRVVTLEEGSKSASGAAQLTREVQLLTTGPTKIANTKEEAYAILEAMSKGATSKPGEALKSPEKALEDTVKVGTNFQKRQNDLTTVLVNFAEKQTLFAAISANALVRSKTGSESSYVGKYLEDSMRMGSEKAASVKFFGETATVPNEKESSLSGMKDKMGSELGK
ncbi:MAG TPA: hypothetical protein VM577_03760, partial [Anaerovoracaceae bacterium]|nr:hypothetical protein [Anaerovoracaceae bacterium]